MALIMASTIRDAVLTILEGIHPPNTWQQQAGPTAFTCDYRAYADGVVVPSEFRIYKGFAAPGQRATVDQYLEVGYGAISPVKWLGGTTYRLQIPVEVRVWDPSQTDYEANLETAEKEIFGALVADFHLALGTPTHLVNRLIYNGMGMVAQQDEGSRWHSTSVLIAYEYDSGPFI